VTTEGSGNENNVSGEENNISNSKRDKRNISSLSKSEEEDSISQQNLPRGSSASDHYLAKS